MKKNILFPLAAAALALVAVSCEEKDESIPGWPWLDPALYVVDSSVGEEAFEADYNAETKTFSFTLGSDAKPVSTFKMYIGRVQDDRSVKDYYWTLKEQTNLKKTSCAYTIEMNEAESSIELGWASKWNVTVSLAGKTKTISAKASTKPADASDYIVKDLGWTDVEDVYGELPLSIRAFKSPETLEGQKAIAYIAVSNTKKGGSWDILGDVHYCDDSDIANDGVDVAKTPDEFYAEDAAPIITNAGLFFWAPKSSGGGFVITQNLVYKNGEKLAVNQTYVTEDWVTLYYPTLGAFYQKEDGTFGTTWTYYNWTGVNYCYPQPADPELFNSNTDASPGADSPAGAEEFKAQTAIGGVGVLVHNGEVVNTWKEEMMDVLADSRHPRTAIGATEDGRIILFVCEGRNVTEGVPGYTTGEVANIMKSLGCVDALNLDGGGSSCMLINGKETIKPSDGEQRSVATGIKLF